MTHVFCKCGYLPRAWSVKDVPRIGSVPVRYDHADSPFCMAVGFRWGWDQVTCGKDAKRAIDGVPMCLRHARVATCHLPHDTWSIHQRWKDRTAAYEKMPVVITDGGAKEAGFARTTGDCVYRAIAIAEQRPYREVAEALFSLGADQKRNGVPAYVYGGYLLRNGWRKVLAKGIFLRRDGGLPAGRLLVHVVRHLLAVIDGTIYDTWDSSANGTRRVKYFYVKETA